MSRALVVPSRLADQETALAVSKLPDSKILIDFNLRADQPGAFDEWKVRAAWMAFVFTHGEALAQIALKLATGDLGDRIALIAERFRALLNKGHASMISGESRRLDLAAPLPEPSPWPHVFAGEPATLDHKHAMEGTLNWHDVNALASWGHTFAYYATGMLNNPPFAVQAVARERLHALLDAAARGLDRREKVPHKRPKRAPTVAKKGGAT